MAAGWLLAKGLIAAVEERTATLVSLTDLGERYVASRLPELRIIEGFTAGYPLTIELLRKEMEPSEVSTSVGALKEAGLLRIGAGGKLDLTVELRDLEIQERVQALRSLQSLLERLKGLGTIPIEQATPEVRTQIESNASGRGRKGIFTLHEKRSRRYTLTESGREAARELAAVPEAIAEAAMLTPEMLKDGSWKGKTFRKYNIQLRPSRIPAGRKHPYREFLDGVKSKLISLGFEEMRGPLVETEFWNSDALYMPQFHPAREIHDVYFVKSPREAAALPEPQASRVAATHREGWRTGSRGWGYAFDPARARRMVLRSQGTAVSARTLASSPRVPGRYFSIARCFRYDLVDATHAPDFFQVEGVALGEEVNFRTLLGLLKLFGAEVAQAHEVQYRPAYFPYTEPSVEMHVKHPKLGWMELGGAGLFRPEVTHPLGVKVPVIAWGLGLDRMAMVALGIQDIRELFTDDLDLIRTLRASETG
jgi:phenylalanyl-tRNA synthetase alpha chain